jgi:fumigallin biosynthesis monooxygenase-like protein
MRVEEPRGLETLQTLGPQIQASVEEPPDGLLLHENITFSQDPPHYGMRQYWRDFDALEAWSQTLPHKQWWTDYLRDRGGTSFWHETYFRRGGFESVFVDVLEPIGLARIAPAAPAHGPMFSARLRRDADQSGSSSAAHTGAQGPQTA